MRTTSRRTRRIAFMAAAVLLMAVAALGWNQLPDGDEVTPAETAARQLAPASGGEWRTDKSRSNVSLDEFQSGGVPRDGIPSIDSPRFVSVEKANFVAAREPVIAYRERAYPLQILTWHEIVNDTVDGVPVAVTFCPLCNTAIVFDRRIDGATLDFGVSGMLRHSDLVMYDRQTETWWQQFNGEALVGELTGKKLTLLPSALISFEQFAERFPNGRVLSTDTGYVRDYGRNPYAGYDDLDSPALFGKARPDDDRLPPKARVVLVPAKGDDRPARVYPFESLTSRRVINHDDIAIFWSPGTASALAQQQIRDARDVGAAAVYQRTLDGRKLSFLPQGVGTFRDRQTGTLWNLLGHARQGPLAGRQLTPVEHVNIFWFAAAAFEPDATVYDDKE